MSELKVVDTLFHGAHDPNGKMCVMEAAAYVAGEEWSDRPACVSPIIGDFLRRWNDSLQSNADRLRLLAPLIPIVLGTEGSDGSEKKRSWMAFDWLARECGPAFMDLTDSLKPHAKALRELGPIFDEPTLNAANPTIQAARTASAAAREAAWEAARAAARAVAREAAWEAAGAAAGEAAGEAAWAVAWAVARAVARAAAREAAWEAAREAARAAAREAAWEAAGAAAGAAARASLAPTVKALHESATELVKRMAEVERHKYEIQRPLRIADLLIGAAK